MKTHSRFFWMVAAAMLATVCIVAYGGHPDALPLLMAIGPLAAPSVPLSPSERLALYAGAMNAAPDNGPSDEALSQDDVAALSYDELDRRVRAHAKLRDTIKGEAKNEGRDLTDREHRRLEDVSESIAIYEAELENRPEANQTRAQFEAKAHERGTPEGSGRKADPGVIKSRNGQQDAAAHARMGVFLNAATFKAPSAALFGHQPSEWNNSEDFLRSVANRVSDPRLLYNAGGREGTGADGGFSVPPEFYRGVVDLALQQSEFAQRCRLFPAASNTLTIPMPDMQDRSSSIGGLKANWAGEGREQSKQRLKWRAVELKLHKTFILAEASNELAEDGAGYTSQLTTAMSAATAYTLDDAILQGSGVGEPLGLIGHASAIQIAAEGGQSVDTVLYENLVNLYSRLTPACQKKATWFISPNLIPQLLLMKFPGSTNPVLLSGGFNDAASGAPMQTIFGRPVVVTEIARPLGDVGDISFVDLSQYALLAKNTARLQYDAGPGFASDLTEWRMITRVGGQPMWNTVVTPYNGGPTLSWATYLAAR